MNFLPKKNLNMIFACRSVERTKEKFVLHLFNHVIVSFDLWMSRRNVDTFISIVNDKCVPCYIHVEFVETTNTF